MRRPGKRGWVVTAVLAAACGNAGPAPADGSADADGAGVPDGGPGAPPDAAPAPAPLPTLHGLPVLEDTNPDPRVVEVNLVAAAAEAELVAGHRTRVLAYNGRVPGPLLQARAGDRVVVHFRNDLDEATTVHWHGLRIPAEMDGSPMTQPPVEPGATFTYDFVVPDAGTFWYHPHLNTVEQIERGLYGAIVVHEAAPPRFAAERVFVLDDVRLDASYQVAPFATAGHDAVHGRAGNLLLTNGAAARLSAAAPRGAVERWRVVNAAGARTMQLAVEGARWRVVGTDGGLIPAPYAPERLAVAAGQRFDLEVTFDGEAGSSARLVSYVLAQGSDGSVQTVARPVAEVAYAGEAAAAPPVYPPVALPELAAAPTEHTLRLGARTTNGLEFTINGYAHDVPMLHYAQGTPVRFTVVNTIGPDHPFHLHGQFFQVVTRGGAPADEPGLKDTVYLGPNETVTIETRFENPGRWMYHCHIPEHAENGMMGEVEVAPDGMR